MWSIFLLILAKGTFHKSIETLDAHFVCMGTGKLPVLVLVSMSRPLFILENWLS